MSTYTIVSSPIGPLTLAASDQGLQHVLFGHRPPVDVREDAHHPFLRQTALQLDAYFAGTRTAFDVPLDMAGTPFQQQVWALLQAIPYGETTTYGALAQHLGDSGKARAVGLANAKNPVAIIVPCHRVIGSSGALTGFAGGLDTKAFLLRLERRVRPVAKTGQGDLFAAR